MSFRLLCEQKDIAPAPYLGRYKWAQLESEEAMTDEDVRLYIDQAYRLVVKKLTKAKRAETRACYVDPVLGRGRRRGPHSTVTLLARFLGWSTSQARSTAM